MQSQNPDDPSSDFSSEPAHSVSNPSEATSEATGEQPWLHIALFQPEIPQNTGNIGRTCVALGAKLWIIRPTGFRLDEKQLRRAGMDYWQHLTWEAVDDWNHFVARVQPQRIWIVTKFGKTLYHNAEIQKGDVLLFGSESSGLPPAIREQFMHRSLLIPMRPEARSLNLSNAVAILAYDAQRRLGC